MLMYLKKFQSASLARYIWVKVHSKVEWYEECILYPYENIRMKTVEIVLRRENRERGKVMEGVNSTKIYFKHKCKYNTVLSCTTIIC
jgi:hypothetical protein